MPHTKMYGVFFLLKKAPVVLFKHIRHRIQWYYLDFLIIKGICRKIYEREAYCVLCAKVFATGYTFK